MAPEEKYNWKGLQNHGYFEDYHRDFTSPARSISAGGIRQTFLAEYFTNDTRLRTGYCACCLGDREVLTLVGKEAFFRVSQRVRLEKPRTENLHYKIQRKKGDDFRQCLYATA